jgi:hypothetical protein
MEAKLTLAVRRCAMPPMPAGNASHREGPGVTIVITGAAQANVLPAIEHEPVPHVWPSVD